MPPSCVSPWSCRDSTSCSAFACSPAVPKNCWPVVLPPTPSTSRGYRELSSFRRLRGVLAKSGRYDAVITLGVVIRGGTPHFEYVCGGVTDGVREVMRDTGVPVAFGVLTTDDAEQALVRAGGSEGNKGVEAARAAVEMATLLPKLAKGFGSPS